MLKIHFKDGSQDAILLSEPGKTIGSGVGNDIVLKQSGVSTFHADLKVEGETVTLSDVHSDTGTHLNGKLISSPTQLRIGDVITIQGSEMEVVDAAEEPADGKTLVLSGEALTEVRGRWSIVAESGPEKGQAIPIKRKLLVGRALACDLSILEPGLSRKHAELLVKDNQLIVRDLESANGTFVNKKKVGAVRLKPGDQVQFAEVTFSVKGP